MGLINNLHKQKSKLKQYLNIINAAWLIFLIFSSIQETIDHSRLPRV